MLGSAFRYIKRLVHVEPSVPVYQASGPYRTVHYGVSSLCSTSSHVFRYVKRLVLVGPRGPVYEGSIGILHDKRILPILGQLTFNLKTSYL
ncbi:hypothetical protein PoB_003138600 [Plakobranchus ocellatus]|uniref:Uncharacterized protein n=1 Tax=Plakobranchus ocellatus TaxID=259542 RepID=A0AAV4A9B0_9GAST|nr:hypothetical protein PoB_003138600 [Plakobranchus ocellatus]